MLLKVLCIVYFILVVVVVLLWIIYLLVFIYDSIWLWLNGCSKKEMQKDYEEWIKK